MNKDIFSCWMKNIDFKVIDDKLMLRQDPHTRAARKAFFWTIDGNGKGALDADELKAGMLQLLVDDSGEPLVPMGDELMPAVRCAFEISRNLEIATKRKKVAKGKKAKVGETEFRAFLLAFKSYLQLLELFEYLDGQADDNQLLSLRECKRGVFMLADWGITEDELNEKFSAVDPWTSYLSFKDFATWCIAESGTLAGLDVEDSDDDEIVRAKSVFDLQKEHGIEWQGVASHGQVSVHGAKVRQSDENRERVMELFAQWDSDKSGGISEDELGQVLIALDPNMTPEQVKALFVGADTNNNGSLSHDEFLGWLLK